MPIKEAIKVILQALLEAAKELGLASTFYDLKITDVYPEGPAIVIHTKRHELVGNDEVAKRAAKKVKKRMEIRADPSIRMDEEEARELILQIVPEGAGVMPMDIIFDEDRGIVEIFAADPSLVIGYRGEKRKEIIRKTGRIPKVIKKPDLPSPSLGFIYRLIAMRSESLKSDLISIGFRIHRPRIYEERGIRLIFLGAAQEVGRSSILIQTPNSNILVDFGLGMHPGRMYPRLDLTGISLEDIDAVVVTHAHMDHVGLIPRLFKFGYKGPVYMTSATRDLAFLLWTDYLRLARRLNTIPPYSEADVEHALRHTIAIDYNMKREDMRSDVTDIAPDVRLTLYNAGHILGSALVHLHIGDGMHNILIAQDFRYSDSMLLERAVSVFPRVETLIIEATYGSPEDNPNRKRDVMRLIREVRDTLNEGGCVLIPVLSVGRAQEVLLHLYFAFKRKQIPEADVYIDGLVAEATAIHTSHTEYLSRGIRRILRRENPFLYERFVYLPLDPERRGEAMNCEKPAIVLASNGMLNGGPSVEYFKNFAKNEKNKIIFVSYQAPGTLGSKVLAMAKKPPERREIELDENTIRVYAKIAGPIRGLTSHSTFSELMRFVSDVHNNLLERSGGRGGIRNVFVIHGEAKKCYTLASEIREKLGLEAYVPTVGEAVKLRIFGSPAGIRTPDLPVQSRALLPG